MKKIKVVFLILFKTRYITFFNYLNSLRKMKSNQECQRERVYNYYLENRSKGKKFTVDHFISENMSERAVYYIIKRAENESGHERESPEVVGLLK